MQRERDRQSSIVRRTLIVLVLAITALIGSVVIPAIESSDVLTSLSDDEKIIEPARLLATQLDSEIPDEFSLLQRYALLGDTASLARLSRATSRDAAKLTALRELTQQLRDGDSLARDVKRLAAQMKQWHEFAALGADEVGPVVFPGEITRRAAARESIVVATARVQSDLARLASSQRSAVGAHELRGLYVNVALVLVAFLAMASMVQATRRERHRASQDSMLRIAAERLAKAFSTTDAAREIADGAIELFQAQSASVWRIGRDGDAPRLILSAVAGHSEVCAGCIRPYRGSAVERAVELGRPLILDVSVEEPSMLSEASDHRRVRAVVITLGTPASPGGEGAIILSPVQHLDEDDQVWAATFGRLAQLAYEKAWLLEDARAAHARLERVTESRNRLMRGFSHDVKNPLAVADMNALLLERGADGRITTEQRQTIGYVRRAIRVASSLLDDLHELARAEGGNLPLRLEHADLRQLVLTLGEQYRGAAHARTLDLVIDANEELPLSITDVTRVREVVGNLLSNAIKYTDGGSITLRASCRECAEGRRAVVIDVVDTGPGIPPDKLDVVFEEFERLSDRQPGAGVGLAISRHIAGAIGGHITVASEVGKGSTFSLSIPVECERDDHMMSRQL